MKDWIFGVALIFGWPLWNWWRERGLQKNMSATRITSRQKPPN